MKKTDISQYTDIRREQGRNTAAAVKSIVKMVWKGLLTFFTVFAIAGAVVSVSLAVFIFSMKDSSVDYDLRRLQLNYTSFIYVNGPNDDSAHPVQYQSLYSTENRVWVDYDKIPDAMKKAIIAIEDKRFEEHEGVDWWRTFGAVLQLFTKGDSYGGSSITQQLIKNVTGEKDVSLTRKVTEIFRALNLEKKYTKQEILTAYLNIVPFGSGTNGVQAAANLYFGKDIQKCDIAECAAIAGITQNPSKYSPLVHPEQNKDRQQVVLAEMHNQGKITDAEYRKAMEESEHMKFVGRQDQNVVNNVPIWNWYVDTLFEDVKNELMEHYNCSSEKAVDMIYHGGLKIYAAMDPNLQTVAENVFQSDASFGGSKKLQGGYFAMDYTGRVLATVGGRGKKTANRLRSLATDSQRQPGSTIKPLSVYGPAIDTGEYTYSTLIDDSPLPNWFSDGRPGPNNAGPGNTSGRYWGKTPLQNAIKRSLNAAASQVGNAITPNRSFTFLTERLHFTSLVPADNNRAPMAIGGLSYGVTVREMTAGYQMFANGGNYYQPYTFYHVDDHDGNVILDHRGETGTQVIQSTTASIMHRLLNTVVSESGGTGRRAAISGWEVFGKTGTTNEDKDSWFVGGTPYAVAGIWTGYLQPANLGNYKSYAQTIWKSIMTQYLKGKPKLKFSYDPNVVSAQFCYETGLLANPEYDKTVATGWYDKNNMPAICDGAHTGANSALSSAPSSSAASSSLESSASDAGQSEASSDLPAQADPGDSSSGDSSSAPDLNGFFNWGNSSGKNRNRRGG